MGGLKQLIQERLDFVRVFVARAYYNSEILAECAESDLFLVARGETASSAKPMRRMSPRTIRAHYIDRVKREVREHKHEASEELCLAYEQLVEVYRSAMRTKDGPNHGAAVTARRELNRMLGLRRREMPIEPVDQETLEDQRDEMDDMMGGNGNDGNQ